MGKKVIISPGFGCLGIIALQFLGIVGFIVFASFADFLRRMTGIDGIGGVVISLILFIFGIGIIWAVLDAKWQTIKSDPDEKKAFLKRAVWSTVFLIVIVLIANTWSGG